MRTLFIRSLWLSIPVVLCALAPAPGPDDKEKAELPVDVYEWSIWVGNPGQAMINASRVYKNAMPSVVGTSRTKFEEKDLPSKFPVAPISVVQFFGDARRDVDVDLRVKKGTLLSHWPPCKEHTGRLQWFGSDLSASPPADIPQSYLPGAHWFQELRQSKSSLFLKNESHSERFIAYDAELSLPIPLRLRGGPGEYTLQNLTNHRLLDVVVIAPTSDGFRVGWLDELPTATPEKKEESLEKSKAEPKEKSAAAPKEKKPAEAKEKTTEPKEKKAESKKGAEKKEKTAAEKAESVFKEAESKTKEEEVPPLPAEGDASIRARVDVLLNRPVVVTVEQAPKRDVLDLIAGQARLRYELDDRTLAKDQINLSETMSMKASGVAARDALADVLGSLGLSYRVTEDGKLFITTATRLADDAGKKGAVIEGPPVKLVMSQPRKPADPSYRELTRDAWARRLEGQGLREETIQFLLARFGQTLFEPGELVVLVHLAREAIDEAVLLDVFPAPRKLTRTALLVIHGVDPRLQDRARVLVQELGDKAPQVREAAEARLAAMGPVAVPVLEDALTNKDVEIVFRAERLLLRLNRPVP